MNSANSSSETESILATLGLPMIKKIVEDVLVRQASVGEGGPALANEVALDLISSHPAFALTAVRQGSLGRHPAWAGVVLNRAYGRTSNPDAKDLLAAEARKLGLAIEDTSKLTLRVPEPRIDVVRTESQERVAHRLRLFAELNFSPPKPAPTRLRLNPLLVGPSGVGKTELVRQLGAQMGIPVLKFTVGDWLPLGARNGVATLHVVRRALSSDDQRIILHLDELEKLGFGGESSPWVVSIIMEIFALLDRHPDGEWKPEQVARLRRNTFIVGSGTWQNLWDRPDSRMGFAGAPPESSMATRVRAARVIPPELINRFNDDWLLLDPYTAGDFVRLSAALNLPAGLIDPEAAANSRLNFRYVENAVTAHALRELEATASFRA